VRGTILLGSAASGLVLGAGCGIVLLALLVLGWAALPQSWARGAERLRAPALALCLGVLPLLGALLGVLEGRLKLR
jgi:hypothetical protein